MSEEHPQRLRRAGESTNSPPTAQGIQHHITRLNGVLLHSPDRPAPVMRSLRIGATIRLTVFRDEDSRDME